ncbi:UDP:flavonoid glycosyltransferase YjiC (YdhE family) [Microbacterium trichothecenolyticum]|uniref:nucleotide disphospho-sugar-binding domain-containing protein n=1 Tax=Microbacterium trichothecenolyticum TaxID=69370 RepID=UPI00286520EA|nr:nucleotide disphospho-sugar-binding domain-containing protein [Microbacterium trichothecenolyticum]MDR7186828.1 UDP:flavonoid glycosyltransferase YjiC (YdhE family) [Microbacterium trichothecenolyticum]
MSSTSYPATRLNLLLCATPMHGHVTPLLAVAGALVAARHDVRFLTGARYRAAVEATGARWVPLPADADYDDGDVDRAFPGRVGRHGVDGARWDLRHIFLDPAPSQLRAVDVLLAERPVDIVLAESLFFGALLLLCRPPAQRPPVVNLGIVPLGLRSRDTAPFALGIPPMPGPLGRARNALLSWTTDRLVFGGLQREAGVLAREVAGGELTTPAMNYPALADAIVQFTVPEFEYPRSDLTVPVHFVGPVSLATASTAPLPEWWGDLDGRRVVHVTQGTVANSDLEDLVLPTARALVDSDVLVVATTGGRAVPSASLPPNLRIAPYLPYDLLFPRLDAFVTNGGYGGVHYALAHGVPILSTGDTEDKAEVSARVAWSGAGLRLKPRKGRIESNRIRTAVDRLLSDPAFRENARRIGTAIADAPGPAGVEDVLRDLAGRRGEPAPRF